MSDKTGIEWTRSDDGTPGATWNVVSGCTKVSDGCLNCYIERTPPFRIAHRRFDGPGIGATTGVALHPDKLTLPLRWKKPRRVFVNSLSDLFHEDVPDEFIAQAFAVMALTPRHTYQLLTKRPGRMRSRLNSGKFAELVWLAAGDIGGRDEAFPLPAVDYDAVMARFAERVRTDDVMAPWPNIWLGVSCENQKWADLRVPALLETPAAVRFISAEPLLGPVDLRNLKARNGALIDCLSGDVKSASDGAVYTGTPSVVDWVICGGESGPGATPMHPDWARSLRDQCAGRAAFFFKQHGEWQPLGPLYGDLDETDDGHMEAVGLEVVEGKQVIQLERDGYIAEGHQPADDRTWLMGRVGKKRAGRELDGETWDEFPAVTS